MVAALQPLPPLLSLVFTRGESTLTIPPAPRLAIVPRPAPALDTAAVHRWVLKLRDLWVGDALDLGEYKICCVASPSFHLQYTIIGLRVLFHEDVQGDEATSQRVVAEWLVRDGKSASDVIVYQKNDADALRLSMVTGKHQNAWYMVRLSMDTLNGIRRLNRKPHALRMVSEKAAGARVEPVRDVITMPVLVTMAYQQLSLL
jgi:hypothetical protein